MRTKFVKAANNLANLPALCEANTNCIAKLRGQVGLSVNKTGSDIFSSCRTQSASMERCCSGDRKSCKVLSSNNTTSSSDPLPDLCKQASRVCDHNCGVAISNFEKGVYEVFSSHRDECRQLQDSSKSSL